MVHQEQMLEMLNQSKIKFISRSKDDNFEVELLEQEIIFVFNRHGYLKKIVNIRNDLTYW